MMRVFYYLLIASLIIAAGTLEVASGPTPQSTSFHIDRVISGARLIGTAPDVSVEDPKTIFELPRDKEVVVYFEWRGAAGTHRFDAIWKNPAGREVGRSGFTAESLNGTFSGSWKMPLNQKTLRGRWTIESWIDNRIVGAHQFEITDNRTSTLQQSPANRVPGLSEIFRKANAATVFIEHVDKNGSENLSGSGFFVSPNTVVTAFSVIDGAETLRLRSGARTFSLAGVVDWNRFQDWAVLRTAEASQDFLMLADSKSGEAESGKRCLALSVGQDVRALAEGAIGGVLSKPNIGDRIVLKMERLSTDFDAMKDEATGSPLMNMRGEVFAIAVGPSTVLPGSGWVRIVRSHNLFEADSPFNDIKVLGVPAKSWARSLSTETVTPLAQFTARKEFDPAVVNSHYIQSGTVALKADAAGNPVGEAFVFRASVKELQVFVTWNAGEKFDGTGAIKVYDENTRLVIDSKPQKTKSPPVERWVVNAGKISLLELRPGTYRVDYLLDGLPAWRSFFRIIPGT